MFPHYPRSPAVPLATLVLGISAALGVVQAPAAGVPSQSKRHETPARQQQAIKSVSSCSDDGSMGTLRSQIAQASNGDTIDLSTLNCSSISLSNGLGEIAVPQQSLYLQGPTDHQLTIDGNSSSRVFAHAGTGKFEIDNLTIAHGFNSSDLDPNGGCINSDGIVKLTHSAVTGCVLAPMSARAYGGGIHTAGDLYLYDSTVSMNQSISADESFGGGVEVGGSLRMSRTSIDNNVALGSPTSVGGGAVVIGMAAIYASTFSRNTAAFVGGLDLAGYDGTESGTISNSTIADNFGTVAYGGVRTITSLTIGNSTIAFNKAGYSGTNSYAGVHAVNSVLDLQSSIVANNTSSVGDASDLGNGGGSSLSAASSKNLVPTSNFYLPADTIKSCARMQPLANNGGGLLTRALSVSSPAIDAGNDDGFALDERGELRVVGSAADIGAVERQIGDADDRIFADDFDDGCY